MLRVFSAKYYTLHYKFTKQLHVVVLSRLQGQSFGKRNKIVRLSVSVCYIPCTCYERLLRRSRNFLIQLSEFLFKTVCNSKAVVFVIKDMDAFNATDFFHSSAIYVKSFHLELYL